MKAAVERNPSFYGFLLMVAYIISGYLVAMGTAAVCHWALGDVRAFVPSDPGGYRIFFVYPMMGAIMWIVGAVIGFIAYLLLKGAWWAIRDTSKNNGRWLLRKLSR